MPTPSAFALAPCLAAGLDWLEGLLPALFVGFWILSQVFALFRRVPRNAAPPKPVPEVLRERRPRPDPAAGFGNAPSREEIERQIEDFLLGRTHRQPPEPQPVKPAARPVKKRRIDGQRPQQVQPQPRPQVPALPPPMQATSPAGGPETFDTDVARHVHDAFAHDLAHRDSALGQDASAPAVNREPSVAVTAPQLARAVRNPATIRQAIMLREVLERPTDRWE